MDNLYLNRKISMSSRAIAKILKGQQRDFIAYLTINKKWVFNIVRFFVDTIKRNIPEYLQWVLPKVMKQAVKDQPLTDYNLRFDIETSPASKYLRDVMINQLSNYKGSITHTTIMELTNIVTEGIDKWLSYTEIGTKIKKTNPFVFSRARANMIAVNEVWRAYGYANYLPAVKLQEDWFKVVKHRHTSGDLKVRATHRQNESDGRISLDARFSWTGDIYAPSHDINCRCYHTYKTI